MKIVQYQRTWRGIDFDSLGLQITADKTADSAFYEAFYRTLGQRPQDPQSEWHRSKRRLAVWLQQQILHSRPRGRILSVGAGEAIGERIWLAQGYDVTLNECQPHTLAAAVSEFPGVKTLIADACKLTLTESYDIAILITVDYALSDRQLEDTFRQLGCALAPNGILLNHTVNTLTFKQLAKEIIKWLIRRPRPRGSIRWGWMRSPGAIIKLAKAAGLEIQAQFAGDDKLVPRARWAWHLMPLTRQTVLMEFRRS